MRHFQGFSNFWPIFLCLGDNQARVDCKRSSNRTWPFGAEKADSEVAEWGFLQQTSFSGRVLHLFISFPQRTPAQTTQVLKNWICLQNSASNSSLFSSFFSDQKFQMLTFQRKLLKVGKYERRRDCGDNKNTHQN